MRRSGFSARPCSAASPHTLVGPVSCLKVRLTDLSCGSGSGEPGEYPSLPSHACSRCEPRSRSFVNLLYNKSQNHSHHMYDAHVYSLMLKMTSFKESNRPRFQVKYCARCFQHMRYKVFRLSYGAHFQLKRECLNMFIAWCEC